MRDLLYPSVRLALCVVFVAMAVDARAVLTDPVGQGTITVKMTPWVTIPSTDGAPQDITTANDGTGRMFVATRNGRIRVVGANGALSGTTFLTMGAGGAGLSIYTSGEGGFAGLAFHPSYLSNGKFYTWETETYNAGNAVDFTHPEMAPNAGGIAPANHIAIREWTATGTPASATTAGTSSRLLMRINHPQNNHQGGGLKFGPDGNLYIALGDGGGQNDFSGTKGGIDGHSNTAGNGQDTTNVFGKILRISPDDPDGVGSAKYGIPAGNPFSSGAGGLQEIFAYGMRNPYRISFDAANGKFYAGDVGQDSREEVDEVIAGGNYGWPYREGSATNSNWTAPGGFTSVAPLAEYRNSSPNNGGGNSITGGFVYRGTLMPQLVGKYIFGDYNGAVGGFGKIFYTDPAGGGTIFEMKYDLTNGGASPASISSQLFSFGEDANRELYATFANGQILRFIPEPSCLGLLVLMFSLNIRRAKM